MKLIIGNCYRVLTQFPYSYNHHSFLKGLIVICTEADAHSPYSGLFKHNDVSNYLHIRDIEPCSITEQYEYKPYKPTFNVAVTSDACSTQFRDTVYGILTTKVYPAHVDRISNTTLRNHLRNYGLSDSDRAILDNVDDDEWYWDEEYKTWRCSQCDNTYYDADGRCCGDEDEDW